MAARAHPRVMPGGGDGATRSRAAVSTGFLVGAFAVAIAGPIAAFPSVRTGGYFFDPALAAGLAGGLSLVGAVLLLVAEAPSRRRPPYPAALLLAFAAWAAVAVFYTVRRAVVENEVTEPAATIVGVALLVVAIVVLVIAWLIGRVRA